jgi:hypothetical protein
MYQSRRTTVVRKVLFALTLLILLAGVAYNPSNTTYSANPPNPDESALPGCTCGPDGTYPIPCYDYGGTCGCPSGICGN